MPRRTLQLRHQGPHMSAVRSDLPEQTVANIRTGLDGSHPRCRLRIADCCANGQSSCYRVLWPGGRIWPVRNSAGRPNVAFLIRHLLTESVLSGFCPSLCRPWPSYIATHYHLATLGAENLPQCIALTDGWPVCFIQLGFPSHRLAFGIFQPAACAERN